MSVRVCVCVCVYLEKVKCNCVIMFVVSFSAVVVELTPLALSSAQPFKASGVKSTVVVKSTK